MSHVSGLYQLLSLFSPTKVDGIDMGIKTSDGIRSKRVCVELLNVFVVESRGSLVRPWTKHV